MQIHPTAIVSPKAKLAEDVVIEAYSIIGQDVTIGSGSVIGPHVIIDGERHSAKGTVYFRSFRSAVLRRI